MKKIFFIVSLLATHALSFAQPSVTGTWTSGVPSNTITEAGNWTSLSNQSIISLVWLTSYTVKVKKTDVSWNSNLSLWVHKTSDTIGLLGSATPAGNTSYIQLTSSDQTFFTTYTGVGIPGLGAASFNVQYEIRGLSVTLPAQTYTTTIVYTISSP